MGPEEMDINKCASAQNICGALLPGICHTAAHVWARGNSVPMPKSCGMHWEVRARNLCVLQLFRNYGKENLAAPATAQV